MSDKESLIANVKKARESVIEAERALYEFESRAENNVYASLSDAEVLEYILRDRAFSDCEGAGNCGRDEYRQEFIVDGKVYVAVLEVEYNRHDKTYYYIDDSEFRIEPKGE